MARAAAALGVVFALFAGGLFSRFAEPHHYTVTFTLDKDGVIRADKDPLFEIDYGYGTDWTFVNNTGVPIDVQFQAAQPAHVPPQVFAGRQRLL
jgi:hypothetical protein